MALGETISDVGGATNSINSPTKQTHESIATRKSIIPDEMIGAAA